MRKGKGMGCEKCVSACVCVYVQSVEAMYVFLSDRWINAGTGRGEET